MLKSNETERLHVTKAGQVKHYPAEMTTAFNNTKPVVRTKSNLTQIKLNAIKRNQEQLLNLGITHGNMTGLPYQPTNNVNWSNGNSLSSIK